MAASIPSNPDPRRLGSPPRNVRLTVGATIVRALLWLAAIGVPTALVIFAVAEARQYRSFRDTGAVTDGRVVSKRSSGGRSSSYYLHFEYAVSGRKYRGRASVPRRAYKQARIGEMVRVTYLPAKPSSHRFGIVDDARIKRERNALLVGALAALLVLGIVAAVIEITFRRSRRLLRDGRAVAATIDELTAFGSRKRGGTLIRYSFRLPSGKVVRGSVRVMRRDPSNWAVGSAVTIVYDKEKPARSALPESLASVVRLARHH